MKTQQVKIQVPEPCHEDWNKMTPKDKGAFCSSCEKVVVDFTKMSDRQLVDFLDKNKGEKTCGKFNSYQVDRKISVTIPPPNYYWRLKQLFVGVFVSLSFPGFSKSIEAPTNFKALPTIDDQDISINLVKGLVKDYYGNPIAAAYVRIYQNGRITKAYTVTDETGAFSLELPENYQDKSIELRVTAQDYSNESLVFNGEEFLEITMQNSKHILGKMAFMPIEIEEVTETMGQTVVSEVKTPCELPPIKGEDKAVEVQETELLGEPAIDLNGDLPVETPIDIMGDMEVEPVVVLEPIKIEDYDFEEIMGDMIAVHPGDLMPKNVTGSVVDKYGDPLSFVQVVIEHSGVGVITDLDGNFKIRLSEELQNRESLTLRVSYVGYNDELITINSKDAVDEEIVLKVTLIQEHYELMGMMISIPQPLENDKPSSFDKNYQEPEWKESGFDSRREWKEAIK